MTIYHTSSHLIPSHIFALTGLFPPPVVGLLFVKAPLAPVKGGGAGRVKWPSFVPSPVCLLGSLSVCLRFSVCLAFSLTFRLAA